MTFCLRNYTRYEILYYKKILPSLKEQLSTENTLSYLTLNILGSSHCRLYKGIDFHVCGGQFFTVNAFDYFARIPLKKGVYIFIMM